MADRNKIVVQVWRVVRLVVCGDPDAPVSVEPHECNWERASHYFPTAVDAWAFVEEAADYRVKRMRDKITALRKDLDQAIENLDEALEVRANVRFKSAKARAAAQGG